MGTQHWELRKVEKKSQNKKYENSQTKTKKINK